MKDKQASNVKINRRTMLKYSLSVPLAAELVVPLSLIGCKRKQSHVKSTNIILISLDTLRADHLGCYGYQRPTSPTLDKIASQGLMFEDVSSSSPWTLPSHGSLLTGLYPNRHGLTFKTRLPKNVVTLADILKEHGYLTKAIVNSHYVSSRYDFDRGFDEFTYIEEFGTMKAPSEVQEKALKWLSRHEGKSFFLFLHYFDLHSDYSSLLSYEKHFVRPYKGNANGTTLQLQHFRAGQFSLNHEDIKHLIDLYDASIRQIDDVIGQLFQLLQSKELLDNSLIIITSDHGEEFLDHGGVLHSRTQYQELIHVPLVIRGPGIPQSKRLRSIVSNVDVMPTILSLIGIDSPSTLDGLDLCPLWQRNVSQLPFRYIFAGASKDNPSPNRGDIRHNNIKHAIRHPRYKLHYDKLSKKIKLYDMANDPHEQNDVASEHSSLVDSMFRQLESFMAINKKAASLPPLSEEEVQKLRSLGYL